MNWKERGKGYISPPRRRGNLLTELFRHSFRFIHRFYDRVYSWAPPLSFRFDPIPDVFIALRLTIVYKYEGSTKVPCEVHEKSGVGITL